MVRAVLDLTRALGLDVVAEGVETAAQRDLLVGLGFTTGQGWLFSRAEPRAGPCCPASSRPPGPRKPAGRSRVDAGVDLATLTAARAAALAHLQSLRREHASIVAASESSNADDEHDPEGATIAFERAQVAALIDAAVARLADLDRAVALAGTGSYGLCESCGEPIGAERLEARPSARTCIGCASRRRG